MPFFNYLSQLVNNNDSVIIIPFGGYANDKKLHTQARVLEDENIQHSEQDSVFKNLYNTYKRFETDEVHNACVRVSCGSFSKTVQSDKEGYVIIDDLHELTIKSEKRWLPIKYELIIDKKVVFSIEDKVLKPSKEAGFGVITDIDDTILNTGVTSTLKWKVIVNSFMKHSTKRLPLKGMQKFCEMLEKGNNGKRENPFFYLSNSPWNIYDYLKEFLTHFKFPEGVLLLRDVGLEHSKRKTFLKKNKYLTICKILEAYPALNFILLGDAGEKDTDIYLEVSKKYPNRILTIYIRSVDSKSKNERVQKLMKENLNVETVLVENSDQAILHAKSKGFIA